MVDRCVFLHCKRLLGTYDPGHGADMRGLLHGTFTWLVFWGGFFLAWQLKYMCFYFQECCCNMEVTLAADVIFLAAHIVWCFSAWMLGIPCILFSNSSMLWGNTPQWSSVVPHTGPCLAVKYEIYYIIIIIQLTKKKNLAPWCNITKRNN